MQSLLGARGCVSELVVLVMKEESNNSDLGNLLHHESFQTLYKAFPGNCEVFVEPEYGRLD